MSQYMKALVAAVIGAVSIIVTAWSQATSDGEWTGDETKQFIIVVVTALVTVYGVYKARNQPAV